MKNVLWLGAYNEKGVFCSNNWKNFYEWLKDKCDYLEIYADFSSGYAHKQFNDYIVDEYSISDSGYYLYGISCNDYILNRLYFWNYNINSENISNIFFLHNNNVFASIEINDYDCFVLIDYNREKLLDLSVSVDLKENRFKCDFYRNDINEMIDEWVPLV